MRRLLHKRATAAPVWQMVGISGVLVLMVVWFYTPLPTTASRMLWSRYHAGTLALVFDRTDAALAYSIGAYYFGNQSKIGTAEARPYDTDLAQEAFSKAISIQPTLPLAHYMRARIAFVNADFDAGIADINAELALVPTNKRPLYMRGLMYAYRGHKGDLDLAAADFREFVAWAPREWAGYNDLAYVLAKGGNYADAVIALRQGIAQAKNGSTNPWLWDALGVMELNLKHYQASVAALEKAQSYAASLTETDWQLAYPGNDPSLASSGVKALQDSIVRNLAKAYASSNQ